MGRSGSVMVREPEYGGISVPDWIQDALYDYLCRRKIEVSVPNEECNANDANHWEIPIPGSLKGRRFVPDCTRIEKAISDLRRNPGRIKDGKTPYGGQVADMLEEGVTAVKKRRYLFLQIDWF